MTAWTYILICADQSYYVGSTTDLRLRLEQHRTGMLGGYTLTRLPVRLVWREQHSDVRHAIAQERQLNGWSRAKKEALISGRLESLPVLSKRGVRPGSRHPEQTCAAGASKGEPSTPHLRPEEVA